jgi:hypothetical protein
MLSSRCWTGILGLALVGGLAGSCLGAHHHNNNNNPATQPAAPATPAPEPSAPAQPSQLTQDETAQSAAATAVQAAEAKLKTISDAAWEKFQQTPEWIDGQAKLTAARAGLDAAKQAASANLASNADYQSALAAKKKAVDDLATAKEGDDPSPDVLSPLATASLEASTTLHKIEKEVLDNDGNVQAATQKLTLTQHNIDVLIAKFQSDLLLDNDYAAAKADVDAAQQSYSDAHAKVASDPGNN